jgi:hypothetical protein
MAQENGLRVDQIVAVAVIESDGHGIARQCPTAETTYEFLHGHHSPMPFDVRNLLLEPLWRDR